MVSAISSSYLARARSLVPWFSPAFLTDYALLILAYHGTTYLYHLHPFKRDVTHYLFNPDNSYPHLVDQVSVELLGTLSLSLPLAIIILVALSRQSLHDLHHGIMALAVSRTVMKLIVECAKNRVGRLRPDFLARCAYDVVKGECTGVGWLVRDGRKSFPSGHSGAAFQGLVLLSLFLAGKNGALAFGATMPQGGVLQSKLLRLGVVLSPLFLAGWIAITRIEDNMHHPTDVLAGSTIGILSAFPAYLIYYPNPFKSSLISTMDTPNLVYHPSSPIALPIDDESNLV